MDLLSNLIRTLWIFLLFQEIAFFIKALSVYLFISCFLSQAPAFSFNAYILLIATLYFFLACKKSDYEVILNMVQAVFWFELLIAVAQHTGHDTLMNWGAGFKLDKMGDIIKDTIDMTQSRVYLGTVFQQMRLASLFAVMSPLLLLKSRWYIIPIGITCILFGTLGYTLAVASGVFFFSVFLLEGKRKYFFIFCAFVFCVICVVRSWSHVRVEIIEGRLPVWRIVIRSWFYETWQHHNQTGVFSLHHFLFGHGMDTFLPLFRVYKHDPNSFNEAHNDWLQLAWETGIIGFGLFSFYCVWLLKRLYERKEFYLISGLLIISVNMFFAFPWRMTQTVLMMVAYVAYCERPHLKEKSNVHRPITC
jgi:hypothetical protein